VSAKFCFEETAVISLEYPKLRLFIVVVVVKIDAFAEKNNMTEAVNVGKEFLTGIGKTEKVDGALNETEMTSLAVPSHPLVERLQNIKVSSSLPHLAPQRPTFFLILALKLVCIFCVLLFLDLGS